MRSDTGIQPKDRLAVPWKSGSMLWLVKPPARANYEQSQKKRWFYFVRQSSGSFAEAQSDSLDREFAHQVIGIRGVRKVLS